jgi:hypothetical protein
MGQIIYNAVDWVSVKLCGISTPFLFITDLKINTWFGDIKVTTWLGVAVMVSTLIYNGIRIYKELKNKS